MRNPINSCILEGSLVRDAVLRELSDGGSFCELVIESKWFPLKNGEPAPEAEPEISFFTVETRDALAVAVSERGKKGRGLRAVGRLKEYRSSDVHGNTLSRTALAAEHVEFRPEAYKEDGGG